jgi:hypothetical protein
VVDGKYYIIQTFIKIICIFSPDLLQIVEEIKGIMKVLRVWRITVNILNDKMKSESRNGYVLKV